MNRNPLNLDDTRQDVQNTQNTSTISPLNQYLKVSELVSEDALSQDQNIMEPDETEKRKSQIASNILGKIEG